MQEQLSTDSERIQWLDIDRVIPCAKNRNKHSEEQIERLAKIIEYQGWRVPIIISTRSNTIASGHGRLLAAKRLGLKTVPVLMQDFKDEEQEIAFRVSDNEIARWAELDLAGINIDLPNLGPDFNIDFLGIENFQLNACDRPQKPERLCPHCQGKL